MPDPVGPLTGTRILSLAELYPGPFATVILADLGADVILIERPEGGDPTRRYPGHFAALNHHKRSVAVNLKHEAGREFFWSLAATADAVVEGFRPGVVDRLGIGPAAARERLPELVYASISGFGQTGPLSDRPVHDLTVQAMAGLLGTDAEAPRLPLADLASGLFGAIGVLTALLACERGRGGARVDVAMLDSLYALRLPALVSRLNNTVPPPYPTLEPGHGIFQTADGVRVTLSIVGEDHHWQALCHTLDLEALARLTAAEREVRGEEIGRELRCAFAERSWASIRPRLEALRIPSGPVIDDAQICEDLTARGLVTETGSPATRTVDQPIVYDGRRSFGNGPAPRLGEHTCEIAAQLGYPPDVVRELERRGVLATPYADVVSSGSGSADGCSGASSF